jgi:hypothetical protein
MKFLSIFIKELREARGRVAQNRATRTIFATGTTCGVRGSALAEILVSGAIILVVMTSLYATHSFFVVQAHTNTQKLKANFLLEEGIEAVKTMRDFGWANISDLSEGSDYYLQFTGGRWATSTAESAVDGVYYRTFVVENVNRSSSGDIATSGGTLDAGTRKLTVTVSWQNRGATSTRELSTYIANII